MRRLGALLDMKLIREVLNLVSRGFDGLSH
jgi:hypothetical protein